MKSTTLRQSLLLFLGCTLASMPVFGDNHEQAATAEKETLYVEYREDIPGFRVPRYNSINNEQDRYYYLRKNFEKVFETQDWPVNIEFQRYPANAPEGAKMLHVNFLGFRSIGRVELELRLYITVSENGEKQDLAVKSVRHVPRALPSSSSIDRDLDEIYTKAAEMVVEDLKQTLFAEE